MQKITFEEFQKSFDRNGVITKKYISMIEEEYNIEVTNKTFIQQYLKALFAQLLFDDNRFYRVLNENDEMLKKINELERHRIAIKP